MFGASCVASSERISGALDERSFLWSTVTQMLRVCGSCHRRHPGDSPNTCRQPLNLSCTIFALVNINHHCFLQRCVQLPWQYALPAAGASFVASCRHSCSKYILFFVFTDQPKCAKESEREEAGKWVNVVAVLHAGFNV